MNHVIARAVAVVAATIVVLVNASCAARFSVPVDAELLCASDAECLAGSVCLKGAGRCVDADSECVIGGTNEPAVDGTPCGDSSEYCLAGFCVAPSCGDGFRTDDEACDDGADNGLEPNACRPDCKLPTCGDAVTDDGESCDDIDGTCLSCARVCPEATPDCDGDPSNGCHCDDGDDIASFDEGASVRFVVTDGDDVAWIENAGVGLGINTLRWRHGGVIVDVPGGEDYDVVRLHGGVLYGSRPTRIDAVSPDLSVDVVVTGTEVESFDVDDGGICIGHDTVTLCGSLAAASANNLTQVMTDVIASYDNVIVCGDRVAAASFVTREVWVAPRDASSEAHVEDALTIIGVHMHCDGDTITWVDDGLVAHELPVGAEASSVVAVLSAQFGVSGLDDYQVVRGHYFLVPSLVVGRKAMFHMSNGSEPYRSWEALVQGFAITPDGSAIFAPTEGHLTRFPLAIP